MAKKAQRKRAQKKKPVKKEKALIKPLAQAETKYFENLIQLSNTYAKLNQQYHQYKFVLEQMEEKRNQIQKDEIKMPILMQLGGNSFYQETDKKKVISDMDDQMDRIKNSIRGIKGQLKQREEAFIAAGLDLKSFAERRFGPYKAKDISEDRSEAKTDKVLFEAEFEELMKDPELQKEFKAKKEEAKKANSKKD